MLLEYSNKQTEVELSTKQKAVCGVWGESEKTTKEKNMDF